ncbi:hypothetical protein WN51_05660 [Melipona quadrifasciata]|uniref:Uncharacterized protein n=1 Tax=Melipona quadrifasciata TaxID=166423 RepID=A0A0N1IT83_9HYME|nr:hypothetical protein WN51_05660 [Melipona quadrifasciata]
MTLCQNWLNRQYFQGWISRGQPISWLPRSPDLTSLDFYLWGTLKEKVYSTEVRTGDELITKSTSPTKRLDNIATNLNQ